MSETMPRLVMLLGLILAVVTVTSGQQLCTDQCVRHLLDDLSGPRVVRLVKELLAEDAPTAKRSLLNVQGREYNLSSPKRALVRNALRKGLPADIVERILETAGILPHEEDSPGDSLETSTISDIIQKAGENGAVLETTTTAASTPVVEEVDSLSGFPENIDSDNATSAPDNSTDPETGLPPRYKLRTLPNGEIVLQLNDTQFKLPEELPALAQTNIDKSTLVAVVKKLKAIGVPVDYEVEADKVAIRLAPLDNPSTPISSEIMKIDGVPQKISLYILNYEFELPGAEDSLNEALKFRPELTYHVLILLASFGAKAEFDLRGQLLANVSFALPPDTELHQKMMAGNFHERFTPIQPFLVGLMPHTFPIGWEPLHWEAFLNSVQVGAALQSLEEQNVDCPPNILAIFFDRMIREEDKLQTLRRGNNISMAVASQRYFLPEDAPVLARALKHNFIAMELVRDALLRVGVDSTKADKGLEVRLPQGASCLLEDLPTFRLFRYRIIHLDDDSFDVVTALNSFNLPRDKGPTQFALESRRLLPQEFVDALKESGVPASMDFLSQEVVIENPHKLTFPIKMSAGAPARLRLYVQGRPGVMSFFVEVNDRRVELPRNVGNLNRLIAEGKVDPLRILDLFKRRALIDSHSDTSNGRHVITLNGQPVEIIDSALISNGTSS